MADSQFGLKRIRRMGRVGALTISFALVACTAGPVPDKPGATTSLASVEEGDAVLIDAPDGLLLMSEGDLRGTMGDPAFVWAEADAQMWRYDGAQCAVFVYLYPDGVRHVDVQGEGLDDSARTACFRTIVAGRT